MVNKGSLSRGGGVEVHQMRQIQQPYNNHPPTHQQVVVTETSTLSRHPQPRQQGPHPQQSMTLQRQGVAYPQYARGVQQQTNQQYQEGYHQNVSTQKSVHFDSPAMKKGYGGGEPEQRQSLLSASKADDGGGRHPSVEVGYNNQPQQFQRPLHVSEGQVPAILPPATFSDPPTQTAAAKNEVIVGEQLHSSLRQQQHRHSCHQQQRGGPDGSDQASNVVLSESSFVTFCTSSKQRTSENSSLSPVNATRL